METARVHLAARWRGGVAARGARAAGAGDLAADDWDSMTRWLRRELYPGDSGVEDLCHAAANDVCVSTVISETNRAWRANKPVRSPYMPAALSPDLLEKMDAYWRAANYLTVGQIYLQDNPLI